jgi:DNA-binding transcriptional MocR family regulator
MMAAIGKYFPKETRVSRPSGGYFLWLELPERVDSLQLFRLALAQGISIAPGPIFSASGGFRHCVRLNYGAPMNKAQLGAMETLGRLIHSFLQ